MKEINKKEIILEDLFFKNDSNILNIIRNLDNYETVVYQEACLDCILNARILKEYIARLDTYYDAGFIYIPRKYDKTIIYRDIVEYIIREIKHQRNHLLEKFNDRYDEMELNLNIIKEIRDIPLY